MNDFSQSPGALVPDVEKSYPPTIWLSAAEALVYDSFTLYHANYGHTQYGDKVFLLVSIDGDPEAIQYTVSFTERSPVYAKMKPVLDVHLTSLEHPELASPFPMKCAFAAFGKSYTITGARKSNPRAPRPPLPVRVSAEEISPF